MAATNFVAAGAYLRELRAQQNISRESISEQLEVDPRTVMRWELGQVRRAGPPFFRFAELVNASIEEVNRLLASPEATQEDGIASAQAWLAREVDQAARDIGAPEHANKYELLQFVSREIEGLEDRQVKVLMDELRAMFRAIKIFSSRSQK